MAKRDWAYICPNCNAWVHKMNRAYHDEMDAVALATHEMYLKEQEGLLKSWRHWLYPSAHDKAPHRPAQGRARL